MTHQKRLAQYEKALGDSAKLSEKKTAFKKSEFKVYFGYTSSSSI